MLSNVIGIDPERAQARREAICALAFFLGAQVLGVCALALGLCALVLDGVELRGGGDEGAVETVPAKPAVAPTQVLAGPLGEREPETLESRLVDRFICPAAELESMESGLAEELIAAGVRRRGCPRARRPP